MSIKDETFQLSDVVKILGLPERRIVHWLQVGLIKPAKETRGTGTKRQWDYVNVIEGKMIESLFEAGLSVQRIKALIVQLRQWPYELRTWVDNTIKSPFDGQLVPGILVYSLEDAALIRVLPITFPEIFQTRIEPPQMGISTYNLGIEHMLILDIGMLRCKVDHQILRVF